MCEQVLRIPLSYFGVCGKTQRNVCIRRNGKESLSLRQKQCVVRYAEVEYSVVMCGTVPVVRIRTGNRCRNCTGTKSPRFRPAGVYGRTGMFPAAEVSATRSGNRGWNPCIAVLRYIFAITRLCGGYGVTIACFWTTVISLFPTTVRSAVMNCSLRANRFFRYGYRYG